MSNMCLNVRKISPLMAILLLSLTLYLLTLLKRIRHQQTISILSRKKRSLHLEVPNLFQNNDQLEDNIGLYIITPTYPRPEQVPELTRLSQTLMVCI